MDTVTLFEVGPRDGLQSLPSPISSTSKIALIDALSLSGLGKIEATSFVNPKWVPQLADAADVMAGITRTHGVSYSALAPNLKGAEAAIEAGCDEIAVFISASQGFSKANLNCSIEDSIRHICPAIERAQNANVKVRGYLSCVIECPYDGAVSPYDVAELAQRLVELGCYEVSLGDTIGSANVDTTREMLTAVLRVLAPSQVAGHFHDTNGQALANIQCSLDFGVRTFDTSIGGLGGCPYAPGSAGNVDTRAVVECLRGLGYRLDLDLAALKVAETIALQIARKAA